MNVRKIRNEMRSGKSIFDLPLRVTFYARVSTDKDEQLNSLENQVQYYTELIRSKSNWTYVPGYIDEGISGTSTKKRDSFLRMIADAKAGRFDFIITKEISRFFPFHPGQHPVYPGAAGARCGGAISERQHQHPGQRQ